MRPLYIHSGFLKGALLIFCNTYAFYFHILLKIWQYVFFMVTPYLPLENTIGLSYVCIEEQIKLNEYIKLNSNHT